jgi:hypothetical protein
LPQLQLQRRLPIQFWDLWKSSSTTTTPPGGSKSHRIIIRAY